MSTARATGTPILLHGPKPSRKPSRKRDAKPAAKPGRKPTRKSASKRAAGPAGKRAELLAIPGFLSPRIAVPALGPWVRADPTFSALMLPFRAGTVHPSSSGTVFLRGTLGADPAHPPGGPCVLFTLPVGMRPSHERYLHATYRDQLPAPVVPVLLRLDTSGGVHLEQHSLMYDSRIWLDGISFVL